MGVPLKWDPHLIQISLLSIFMKHLDPSRILYEDNHLFVYHKPAGLPVQGDQSGDLSLQEIARNYIKEIYNKPGNVYLALPHRIDRPVSGIVIMTKTSKAHTRMTKAFKDRAISKFYIAALSGPWQGAPEGTLLNYLWKDHEKNIVKVVQRSNSAAKLAKTHYRVIRSEKNYSIILLSPVTGRSHQLRVQIANAGNPIIGDVKYGGLKHGNPRAILLHHYKITIPHPIGSKPISFSCGPFATKEWKDYSVNSAEIETAIDNLLK